jgi:outer membrane lipoprotein
MAETRLSVPRRRTGRSSRTIKLLSRIVGRFSLICALLALIAGCAAPVFKDTPATVVTPIEIAHDVESGIGTDVVWGGKILEIRNEADRTEMQVVAYPLDAAQRPDPSAPTLGRFIVALPGFVEPLDYPPGRFVTLRARIAGSQTRRIDERDLVLPVVADAVIHLWPVNFPYERPRIGLGIGVGVDVGVR